MHTGKSTEISCIIKESTKRTVIFLKFYVQPGFQYLGIQDS